MVTIEIKENSKQARAFIELAKTLSFVKIKEAKTPDKQDFLEGLNLSKKEKVFYRKFGKGVEELRAVEAGKLDAIPLEKTLNEI